MSAVVSYGNRRSRAGRDAYRREQFRRRRDGGELAQRLLVASQQQLRLICFAVSFKLAIASFSGRLLTKLVNNRNVDRGAVNARVSSRKETEESADIHNSILHIWSAQWNAPKVEQ